MTKSRFSEMVLSLMSGNTIELAPLNGSNVWTPARLHSSGTYFEVNQGRWYPAPLGGAGHEDWRYSSVEGKLV